MNKKNNILKYIPVIIMVLIFIMLRLLTGSSSDDYADDNSDVEIVNHAETEADNVDLNDIPEDKKNTESLSETTEDNSVINGTHESDNNETVNNSNDVEISYTFRKQSLFEQHFEKHGAEMGYSNKEDYLAGANRVINDPNSLHKIEEEDGDDIYYLESTNEIVFVSQDGYIRTFFSPSRGIDYYNKQ